MTRRFDSAELLDTIASDHLDDGCVSVMDRWLPVAEWMEARLEAGFDATCKMNGSRIGPRIVGRDRGGRGISGINFAAQDYLNLASHPRILAAASAAGRRFGVHSAGTAVQMGLNPLTTALEDQLATFLRYEDATVFPSGWAAGYGAIRTLVREGDHVLIGTLAHDCLREGAAASGARVHRMPHLSLQAITSRLERLREEDPQAGILVVTESLFATESDAPDLRALQALCKRHAATLLVDVSHDLGVLGETGRGAAEIQNMLGRIDVMVGSFSKVFAANGGFVASSHPAVKVALRLSCSTLGDSNAVSPVQAAIVLAALEIVASEDGRERRESLMANARHLRERLIKAGFELRGEPGPVVTVRLGPLSRARRLTAEVLANGALVNLSERIGANHATPGAAVWRLRVMAGHGPEEIDGFVDLLIECRKRLAEADEKAFSNRYVAA